MTRSHRAFKQSQRPSGLVDKAVWRPSILGQLMTAGRGWSIHVCEEKIHIQATQSRRGVQCTARDLRTLVLDQGWLWATIRLQINSGSIMVLKGIKKNAAQSLFNHLAISRAASYFEPVLTWHAVLVHDASREFQRRGWLSHTFKTRHLQKKPSIPNHVFEVSAVSKFLARQERGLRDAIEFWLGDFDEQISHLNEHFVAQQLVQSQDFFTNIERSALTEDQARAVLCFDNRVLVLAAAGSGKTSTMVAKAAYAIKQGYFAPSNILLLAFNRDAATALESRLKERAQLSGLSADDVTVKTFSAFGLEIIGQATGRKPSLAPWTANELEAMQTIVEELKTSNSKFRFQWDLFRLVLANDLPYSTQTAGNKCGQPYITLNNEIVKSHGEQMLANWFFYNGIRYEYERPYCHDTTTATRSQYCPDFYFPDINVYLEHWALDHTGQPPSGFHGYLDDMQWKKSLHAQHGTTLIETTTAGLWSGKAFIDLAQALTDHGLTLAPDSNRQIPGRVALENPRLLRKIRSFLTHVKNNRLTPEILFKRLSKRSIGKFTFRHKTFLQIFAAVWGAWEDRLQSGGHIDFEDMINLATDSIERGQWDSPYELIMVDEFQDTSQGRCQFLQGLMKRPDSCLFVVGDDWQSINRFAGADPSIMIDFAKRNTGAVTLNLRHTFRCPQSLCDISSDFVTRNPAQLHKDVISKQNHVENPLQIVRVSSAEVTQLAVKKRLEKIASFRSTTASTSVLVLGRYRRDMSLLPTDLDRYRMKVQFLTIHSAKGLEADHVIVVGMVSDMLGFPSQIEDDPLLQLCMPRGEDFDYAEERRLFYVALTRAKSTVTLMTVAKNESPFIWELLQGGKISVVDFETGKHLDLCDGCKNGFLVSRRGKQGEFMGCTNFPSCTFKRSKPARFRDSLR